MPEKHHIPLGKVQAAYDLTDEELYNLIQKLWESKQLFYKELWAETYEKFWHFAATGSLPYTQEKLPELPEPSSLHQSNFYPLFYGTQMVRYLMQLIKTCFLQAVPAGTGLPLRYGLRGWSQSCRRRARHPL